MSNTNTAKSARVQYLQMWGIVHCESITRKGARVSVVTWTEYQRTALGMSVRVAPLPSDPKRWYAYNMADDKVITTPTGVSTWANEDHAMSVINAAELIGGMFYHVSAR